MEKLTNSGKALLATISSDGKYVVNVVDEGTGKKVYGCVTLLLAASSNHAAAEISYEGLTFSPNGDFPLFRKWRSATSRLRISVPDPVLAVRRASWSMT